VKETGVLLGGISLGEDVEDGAPVGAGEVDVEDGAWVGAGKVSVEVAPEGGEEVGVEAFVRPILAVPVGEAVSVFDEDASVGVGVAVGLSSRTAPRLSLLCKAPMAASVP
jgi:hypothetical protein